MGWFTLSSASGFNFSASGAGVASAGVSAAGVSAAGVSLALGFCVEARG
jgi:hypothetical protein